MSVEAMGGARATRRALWIAGGYAVLGSAYIVASTVGVALAVDEVTRATRIEVFKGLGFMAVTGVLLFVASRAVLRKADRDSREIAASREALLWAERRAQASILASTVAHDLNNLLTVIRSGMHGLRARSKGEGAAAILDDVDWAVDEGVALVRRMSRASHVTQEGEAATLDLAACARAAHDLIRNHHAVREVEVTFQARGHLLVRAHDVLARQLIINLVINGAEATGAGGSVEITVDSDGGDCVLEVHDDGPGIEPDVRARLFQAFVTSKPTGTGLGLVSCKMIAESLGGTIEATESPRGGACFRVRLPATDRTDGG